ncbi:MobC family plasmid mobilization relaxosome protein [Mucilaginibacter defluvii]|uniref:Bacterial mobilisation domain-containing protein n=1 Tax=Mucilaginibacter defluvii TaxID=1196019 RepID=A0ABP9FT46_9SPHI
MARPKVSKEEKRSVIFTIRLTLEEQRKLNELGAMFGISPRLLAREKIFRGSYPKQKMPRIDVDVYTELKKIGININQLARHVNSGKVPYGLRKVLLELSEQQQLIIKLLLD